MTTEGLGNVTLVHDDLFASQLEPASFDLVHARALIDPDELQRLRAEAERELQDPGRWGLDFTLVQIWGRRRA